MWGAGIMNAEWVLLTLLLSLLTSCSNSGATFGAPQDEVPEDELPQSEVPVPVNPKSTAPIRIMPLGDSITYGYPAYSYRCFLKASLALDDITMKSVGSVLGVPGCDDSQEGHVGWTIGEIKEGVDGQSWLESARPDVILLMIGTNDILRSSRPDSYRILLSTLIDDIHSRLPKVTLIVGTLAPIPGREGEVQIYNQIIQSVVIDKARGGMAASLADIHSSLGNSDLVDGLHPTQTGYQKMASVWRQAIISAR